METIQGEAKPATPCASSLGLAQTGISRAITGQTRSISHKEEESIAVPQCAGGWLSPARAERWGAHGHVRQHRSTSPGRCRSPSRRSGCKREAPWHTGESQVSKTQQICIFAQERKMKPPVWEPHHFHLPFNQPLPASPAAWPSQVQAVILFLSQKGARGLACWIWQFIKQIKSLA